MSVWGKLWRYFVIINAMNASDYNARGDGGLKKQKESKVQVIEEWEGSSPPTCHLPFSNVK